VHDFTLYKESVGVALPEEVVAWVDLGYVGILKYHANTFIPLRSSKYHALTEEEKSYNREIVAVRIAIEHVNAKIKTFKMLAVPYRNRGKRFDKRMELDCGIINFEWDK